MHVRLLATALGAALAFPPLVAHATISPDSGYGDAGVATVVTDCTGDTRQATNDQVGYGGRAYVLVRCGYGYHRIFAVGDNGRLDPNFGANGRVTVKVPSACLGESPQLVPAKDGSLYALFWGLSAPRGSRLTTDMHLCIARVNTAGDLDLQFGGSSPIRRLDRLSSDFTFLTGGAVDDKDRLLVFSYRETGYYPRQAVFINRYTVSGKPDTSFSSDGQRVYKWPYQDSLQWGGVINSKPVIAIRANTSSSTTSSFGTGFVRFDERGNLDKTFSGDGKLFIGPKDIGGAHIDGSNIAVDSQKRIVYIAQQGAPYQTSRWLDLRRLTATGLNDAAFASATARILAPTGLKIAARELQFTAGRYAVNWEVDDKSNEPDRLTGFTNNGTRWTALGPYGTAHIAVNAFAPDRAMYYEFVAGPGPNDEQFYRHVVQ